MALLADINRKEEPDNRYFPRWKVKKRAYYQLKHKSDEKEAIAVDLSCAGACIVTKEPLLPTQRIKVNVFLNEATVVSLNGRIAWVKHIPHKNEAGIDFDAMDQRIQDVILEHAFDIKKDDLINHWFKGWD